MFKNIQALWKTGQKIELEKSLKEKGGYTIKEIRRERKRERGREREREREGERETNILTLFVSIKFARPLSFLSFCSIFPSSIFPFNLSKFYLSFILFQVLTSFLSNVLIWDRVTETSDETRLRNKNQLSKYKNCIKTKRQSRNPYFCSTST